MIGDKLASGAASATFPGPRLKFDQHEMQQDLHRLPAQAFLDKYMMTSREYELLMASDGEKTEVLVKQIQDQMEAIERLTQLEKSEDEGLKRECFIRPYGPNRVIVSRDNPQLRKEQSKLALPRHLRTQRERLPTTGHVIDLSDNLPRDLMGKRVLFGPMSGTAICFKGFPTWIMLDSAEILGVIEREDAQIIEEELEPLTT